MSRRRKNYGINNLITTIIIYIILFFVAYTFNYFNKEFCNENVEVSSNIIYFNIENIPDYTNKPYIEINNNKPYFNEEDYTTESFEKYSNLDSLGRCGVAFANVCIETMPKKDDVRGDISFIYPSGWKQVKFEDEFLYNRCHLIAYSLSNENDNKLNLITGTRYFNTEGMLPFEKLIVDYIYKNKNNHVIYRVTPIFKGNNLLASGVEMEAYSVEDNGQGICFNIYVYNVQPGANIDYATGKLVK